MQETVQDRARSWHIAQKFAPLLQRSVAGHDGGPVFVSSHDHFEKMLAGVPRQLFEAKIINDQKLWIEITAQGLVTLVERFIFHEIAHQIEDGTVKHLEVHFDGFVANSLSEVRFSDAWRSEKKHVLALSDKVASGQVENLFTVDGWVKTPIEIFKCFESAEISSLGAPRHLALPTDIQFVL